MKEIVAIGATISVVIGLGVLMLVHGGNDRLATCPGELAAAASAIEQSEQHVRSLPADAPWDRCPAYRSHLGLVEEQKPVVLRCMNAGAREVFKQRSVEAYLAATQEHYRHLIAEECR
jgi:hypothetical protein